MASREFIARLTTICSIWRIALHRPAPFGQITTSIRSPAAPQHLVHVCDDRVDVESLGCAACRD